MTIKEIQEQIVEEFSIYEDWMDKYAYIIELGSELRSLDSSYYKDENLIKGCQSKVWFHATFDKGVVRFEADSDAIITKGIAAILIKVFSGQKPDDIINADLQFLDDIGINQHLSPTRSNGLLSMVKQVKMYALAFSQVK